MDLLFVIRGRVMDVEEDKKDSIFHSLAGAD